MAEVATRGTVLVAIAREAIGERLGLGTAQGRSDAWLLAPAASFVTLHLEGELRGCIGSIDARRPLGADVAHNARAAAFEDPRFLPLQVPEFAALEVEVSLLSPRSPVAAASESEALGKLRPGVDGVYLEFGRSHATFLPQVWESIPDPLEFLSALRRKADLPARFWHADLRLTRYTVEKFHDDERPRA
jgi:AmmeMemoRadiSam system protein A